MSSHHIVRENQEPALLVLQASSIAAEELGQLLEWSPTILTESRSYEELTSQEIKIDLLFTAEEQPLNLPQEHIKLQQYRGDFIAAAFDYLINNNFKAVNILATDFPLQYMLDYADKLNIVLLGNGKRTITAKSGYEKWKPQGEVVALHSDVTDLQVTGLEQLSTGTYRTLADGFYSLVFSAPTYCLVAEEF